MSELANASASSATEPAAAERRQAVILFAELRNFTGMSGMLDAQTVLQLASQFFSLVARVSRGHGGEAIANFNDSIMLAFRRAQPALAARQAVQSAQEIQLEFGTLADAWERDYGLRTAVSMGLHLGEVVFGLAGPKGGASRVAFGDAVSVAERLVHLARSGEFVLSDSVMGALTVANIEIEADPLPPLELARRPAIPVYGVLLDTRLDFT